LYDHVTVLMSLPGIRRSGRKKRRKVYNKHIGYSGHQSCGLTNVQLEKRSVFWDAQQKTACTKKAPLIVNGASIKDLLHVDERQRFQTLCLTSPMYGTSWTTKTITTEWSFSARYGSDSHNLQDLIGR